MFFIILFKVRRFKKDALKFNFRQSGGPELFSKNFAFLLPGILPPLVPSSPKCNDYMENQIERLNRALHSYPVFFFRCCCCCFCFCFLFFSKRSFVRFLNPFSV